MDWYDWLLFFHVAAAFLLVTGVFLLTAVLLESRRPERGSFLLMRVSPLAEMLWNIGGVAVLVFGIWLALHGTPQDYDFFDGWIIAAIVLWLVASAAGGPITKAYREARAAASAGPDRAAATAADQRAVLLHTVMVVATAALLYVMIYKPGAGG